MSNSVGGGSILIPATVRANLEWAFIQIIGSNAIDRRPKGLVTTSHRGSSMRDPRELAPASGQRRCAERAATMSCRHVVRGSVKL
jgi:hypothetical protein